MGQLDAYTGLTQAIEAPPFLESKKIWAAVGAERWRDEGRGGTRRPGQSVVNGTTRSPEMAATEGLRLGAPTLLAGSPPRRFLVLSEPALLASRRSLLILACRCRAGNFRAGRMAVWAVSEAKGP